jgi:hypothetical protein
MLMSIVVAASTDMVVLFLFGRSGGGWSPPGWLAVGL